ncbi:MAG: hypothetical protein U1F48_17720 [Burkholderiales bacterium]
MTSLVPDSEALRHAVRWLADNDGWTAHGIQEACGRFDVSPADEEFLLRELRRREAERRPPGDPTS